jgi:hypothetical protein
MLLNQFNSLFNLPRSLTFIDHSAMIQLTRSFIPVNSVNTEPDSMWTEALWNGTFPMIKFGINLQYKTFVNSDVESRSI